MPANTKSKRSVRRTSHHLFVGIDGGGTKTHAVLMNSDKEIVGEALASASNPLRIGIEAAVGSINKSIVSACDAANRSTGDIVAIECGLAGVRREDLRYTIRQRLARNFGITVVEVLTDAEIALFGITLGKAGLVVIAGTGSICLGINDRGEKALAGGWGPLAGDEGGGAGIARRALQSIAKASDGRGKPTDLSHRAAEYFRTSSPDDLIIAIYSPQTDNAKIAGFARYVVEAAKEGDEIAKEIIREAGLELGIAATAVIKNLKLQRKTFPVGYVGSIFRAGDLILQTLIERIHQTAPKAFLTEPQIPPAHAAAQMAFANFNGKIKS